MKGGRVAALAGAASLFLSGVARADCPAAGDSIITDRPTVANSSSVVPAASLQFENGFGASQSRSVTTIDLPETRARLGLVDCTEFLVDLPDYYRTDRRGGVEGASNLGPALKHQFQGMPDGVTLSGAIGVFLNSGDKRIAGRGPAPYLQLPWSTDLGEGWSLNGMLGLTFHPRDPDGNPSNQATLYLDQTIADNADLFVEYANDFQRDAPTLNRLSLGGSYRATPTTQLDLKLGAGLNAASPDWYLLIGYSVRFDQLWR